MTKILTTKSQKTNSFQKCHHYHKKMKKKAMIMIIGRICKVMKSRMIKINSKCIKKWENMMWMKSIENYDISRDFLYIYIFLLRIFNNLKI
jgi:hypothetical protein